jgi:hypothetical protein
MFGMLLNIGLKDKVEIAILDEGIGIKASLLNNPSLTVNNDEQALI